MNDEARKGCKRIKARPGTDDLCNKDMEKELRVWLGRTGEGEPLF